MTKPPLLFLAHRLPYPPNKGDKLRAYHFLKRLATRFDIHLGSLIDDPEDRQYLDTLAPLCASIHIADICQRHQSLAGLHAVYHRQPATYSMFTDRALTHWVIEKCQQNPDMPIFAYSSGIAPYLRAAQPYHQGRIVLDFVDVDSAKWEALAPKARFPMRQIYRREARLLHHEEIHLSQQADASVFVSNAEAALFTKRTRQSAISIPNGVEFDYWQQGKTLPSPYTTSAPQLIFTGMMNYPPNVEAVLWFVNQVFPVLQAQHPALSFTIAGGAPVPEIHALNQRNNITVTGRVEDMRPWIAHATVSVAPLLVARGIQNKVLEAMAAGTICIASPQALEGLEVTHQETILCADSPERFISEITQVLQNPAQRNRIAQAAETQAKAVYSWQGATDQLMHLLCE